MLRIVCIMSLCCLLLSAAGCAENAQQAVRLEEPSVAPVRQRESSVAPAQTPNTAPFYIEVRGHVFYRNPVRVAGNFLCLVRLMDLGNRDDRRARPREIDRLIVPGPLVVPLPYTLAMEGHTVNPMHAYVVEAFIFAPENPQAPEPDSGALLFRSKNPVPVLTRGNPALADIELTMRPLSPD